MKQEKCRYKCPYEQRRERKEKEKNERNKLIGMTITIAGVLSFFRFGCRPALQTIVDYQQKHNQTKVQTYKSENKPNITIVPGEANESNAVDVSKDSKRQENSNLETKVVQVVGSNGENELDYKIENINNKNEAPIKYTYQDHKDIQNILYAESANQSKNARKLIARVILNRVESREYPSNIHDVIFQRNAFSCINDKRNKNWEQATGELKRNEYEEMIYKRCGEDARVILNGEKLGLPCENKLIAYHDNSVKYEDLVAKELELKKKYEKEGKIYKGYWINLQPIFSIDELTFCAPKEN